VAHVAAVKSYGARGMERALIDLADAISKAVEAVERAGELATTEGNVLAFSVVGLLALGSMLSNDWRWEGENLTGKPTVKGSDGRVYTYELSKGRQRVTIYLPTGRLVEHTVTAAAARDKRQLADEVSALVEDLYLIG